MIQINSHKNSDLDAAWAAKKPAQQKMGLRPLVCSAKSWYYTTVPVLNIRRRCAKNKPAWNEVEELRAQESGSIRSTWIRLIEGSSVPVTRTRCPSYCCTCC